MGSSNDLFGGGSLKLWVSGQAYQPADRVIDPVDYRVFYRITGVGSGATRPALDYANWSLEGYPAVPSALQGGAILNTLSDGAYQNGPMAGVVRAGGISFSWSGANTAAWVDVVALSGRGCVDVLTVAQASAASGSNSRILLDDVVAQTNLLSAAYNSGGLNYWSGRALIGGGAFYVTDNAYAVGASPMEVDFERSFKFQVYPNHNGPSYLGAVRYKLRK